MIEITSDNIITPELEEGAIYHDAQEGFHTDYLLLHCLLKIYKPKRVCEIGTHLGVGTKIIKNALGESAKVFSLDLPEELAHVSLQHPISEGKSEAVGSRCDLPFTQLWGDSRGFDFSKIYPIDGWWIDAEHQYENVYHETQEAIKSNAKIIIYHDANMEEVWSAILDSFEGKGNYILHRVTDSAIAYAIKYNI